jgi:thiol-disulfide isomerase/thioredoxin
MLAALMVSTLIAPATAQDLKIGDKAPQLDVKHWISKGKGKFKEVKEFEDGKVYVVEFWATWCGPCIMSMPHIVKLQEKFADSGVQIISISDEDLETVEDFLKGDVADGDGTYAELTSAYCLTTDPDGGSQTDYMEAAGENGIPTAFIVGKTGQVEWIGHPMDIDESLQKIVDDRWDRAAFLKERQDAAAADEILQEIMPSISRKMEKDDAEGAIEILDEKIGEIENSVAIGYMKQVRLSILMMDGSEKAAAALAEFAEENRDEPMMLNQIAWGVVEQQMDGQEVSKELIAAATKAAQVAVDSSPADGAVLDTLAHLLHMQGNLDKAIEVQTKAVEHGGEMAEELRVFLDELVDQKDDQDK